MNRKNKLAVLIDLGKFRIAIPVVLSCLTGYVLFTDRHRGQLALVLLGILLIVAGSSALNHLQEYKQDALMQRTRYRPIPSGRISILEAIRWSIFFLLSGLGLLALGGTPGSLWLAILSILWYNLVYTPLKLITAFAVVPGALCGAFPPLIGWVAAGGNLLHPTILALSFFFFIGQIPHFWLLLLIHGEDYKRAGFKVLTDIFSPRQLRRITLAWMLSTIGIAMVLPLFGLITSHILIIILICLSIWLMAASIRLLGKGTSHANVGKLFIRLNLFFLFIMLLIIANATG